MKKHLLLVVQGFLFIVILYCGVAVAGTGPRSSGDWIKGAYEYQSAFQSNNNEIKNVTGNRSIDGTGGESLQYGIPCEGFISVANNKRYFKFCDGTPFVPIGHNDVYDPILFLDTERLDEYLEYMKAHGENLLRIMLDGGGESLIELRVGEFNPELVAALDNLINAAEKHGIYLILSLWISLVDNNPIFPYLKPAWDVHPYNINHDPEKGLVANSGELLTNEAAIAAGKNRMRFFIERWGASQAIFAWEFWNEINVMGTVSEQNYWMDEMGAFSKQLEMQLYGQHHLRTVSTSFAGWGTSDSGVYTSTELDFTSYHTYGYQAIETNPFEGLPGFSRINPIDYFSFIYENAKLATQKSTTRPFLGTEDWGIIWDLYGFLPWPLNQAYGDYSREQLVDSFIGSAWASVMGGGAGASLRWPCTPMFHEDNPDGYRALSTDMYMAQRALNTVLFDINWTSSLLNPANDDISVSNSENIISTALSNGNQMLIWLLNNDQAFDRSTISTRVTLPPLGGTNFYDVYWYDLRNGQLLKQSRIQGPDYSVRSPNFKTFVAATAFVNGRENAQPGGTEIPYENDFYAAADSGGCMMSRLNTRPRPGGSELLFIATLFLPAIIAVVYQRRKVRKTAD